MGYENDHKDGESEIGSQIVAENSSRPEDLNCSLII